MKNFLSSLWFILKIVIVIKVIGLILALMSAYILNN